MMEGAAATFREDLSDGRKKWQAAWLNVRVWCYLHPFCLFCDEARTSGVSILDVDSGQKRRLARSC